MAFIGLLNGDTFKSSSTNRKYRVIKEEENYIEAVLIELPRNDSEYGIKDIGNTRLINKNVVSNVKRNDYNGNVFSRRIHHWRI